MLRTAQEGDPACLIAVEATARWISVGLVDLVNSLNPEMLILEGMFEELLDLVRPTIFELLHQGIYDAEHQRVELVKPHFGRDAVLVGAAELALQVILDDPASVPLYDPQQRAPIVPLPTRFDGIAHSQLESLPKFGRS